MKTMKTQANNDASASAPSAHSATNSAPAVVSADSLRERLLNLMLAAQRKQQKMSRTIRARGGVQGPVPLSFAQERLWFVEQLGLVGTAYNMPMALRLEGHLDVRALERSFDALIRRHESLRTRFVAVNGSPMQLVDPPAPFTLVVHDLSHVPEKERRARELRDEEAHQPFDLSKAPPLRVSLLRLSPFEHVLLVTMHHIVSDGWSLGILNRELNTLYRAHCEGQAPVLPDLPIQYADYATWQRQWLQGEVLQQQLTYWKQRLHDAPSQLELPTDRPRPLIERFGGASIKWSLSMAASAELMQLAKHEGATLFMVVLAAYQLLLSRWSGQDDVVVGTPIAGRTQADTEDLIGAFINMLPLRTELSGNPTFREFLARVKQTTLDAYAHQEVPFEKLVTELRPERNLARQPIFQVTLALQNYPAEALELPGLRWTWTGAQTATTPFDLTLHLSDTPEGLRGSFQYATDLFDAPTIERISGHFRTLLEGILANPDSRVQELPLLTSQERQHLLMEWNATESVPSSACFVHELFSEAARRAPQALAVTSDERQLTYAELEQRSNQVARFMRTLGIGTGHIVGVYIDRSPELIVALLGILKAGAAYLPLDTSYPEDRLAFMRRDSGAGLLVSVTSLARDLKHAGRTVCLDRDWAEIAAFSSEPLPSGAAPHDLAYVIYTSGSTGMPKAACIPHEALANQITWMIEQFGFTAQDIVLQKTPLSFDASVWEVFVPLSCGAQLRLARPDGHKDPAYLCRLVIDRGVTVLQLVPSMLQLVASEPAFASMTSLRHLFSGGEALSSQLRNEVLRHIDVSLHNLYGPTETCIQVVTFSCDRSSPSGQGHTVPIGRPVRNTSAYVLDSRFEPVPIGVPGELFIGGLQVARGYLGKPALTAERFLPDPFGAPGRRMYRTGDRARYLGDGNLEFLGRVDGQVKIRGHRIELGEVEAILGQHAAVKHAAVLAREDAAGEKRIVAYVVGERRGIDAHDDEKTTAQQRLVLQLREYVNAHLPKHMVPATWVVMEEFPLTPSGKIDRRALPKPEGRAEEVGDYVAPRTSVERALAELWAQLLNLDRVGIHDNFFELGGHSLHGIKLIAKIAERLEVHLSAVAVFQYPTIEQMARAIDASRTMQEALIAQSSLASSTAQEDFDEGVLDFESEPVLEQCVRQAER